MKKFMDWMANSFAPRMNKLARNPWVAAVQDSILTTMPVIFIGSFATLLGALGDFVPILANIQPVADFSMGLMSLLLSFLIPLNLMEKKKHRKLSKQTAIAGLALFLMLCGPVVQWTEEGISLITFVQWNLGNGGMLTALIAGLFASFVMNMFAGFTFFKKDSAMPDFITVWFDTLIPMFLILVVGWILVFVLNVNVFAVVEAVFAPLMAISDSLLGFVLFYFISYAFLYTFGISTWLLASLEYAIILPNFAINEAAVLAGGEATKIMAYGTSTYFLIGGGGTTLALGLMFLFAKSKKNRLIGKTSLVPSLANINEPLIFGAPVAFNPILMIPMWIIGVVGPLITYLAMNLGFVVKPSIIFPFWYLPAPFGAFAVGGVAGLILLAVIFLVSFIIYYPFFKVYDNQCVAEEAAETKTEEKE